MIKQHTLALNQVINLQIAVMIKRKSTLDQKQKAKRNRQVQIYAILDLCLQIPTDDKLLIRTRIPHDDQLANTIYNCKKEKNYNSLQVYLRKFVHALKKNNKKIEMNAMAPRDPSSHRRGRTPLTLKSRGVVTESSYHNSRNNSLQSSPSGRKPPPKAKITLSRFDIERHIEKQIDRQILTGINNEECIAHCRGITPRQEEPSQLFLNDNPFKKQPQFLNTDPKFFEQQEQQNFLTPKETFTHSQVYLEPTRSHSPIMNIKQLLRQKMKKKATPFAENPHFNNRKRLTLDEECQKSRSHRFVGGEEKEKMKRNTQDLFKSSLFYKTIVEPREKELEQKQNECKYTPSQKSQFCRDSYRGSEASSSRNPKYGEFYKRIRMAIEGADE